MLLLLCVVVVVVALVAVLADLRRYEGYQANGWRYTGDDVHDGPWEWTGTFVALWNG